MAAAWDAQAVLVRAECAVCVAALAYDVASTACTGVAARMRPELTHVEQPRADADDEHDVDPGRFWRHMAYAQHALLALVVFGLALTAPTAAWPLRGGQVFWAFAALLPLALRLATPLLRTPPAFRGAARWRAICCVTSMAFAMMLGEAFRAAFGAPFGVRAWLATLDFAAVFALAGCLPGRPAVVSTAPEAVALSTDELGAEAHGEAPAHAVPVAAVSAWAQAPLGLLFFAHFARLVRATQRLGYLRALDVPVMGRAMQARTLAARADALLRRWVPRSAAPRGDAAPAPPLRLWSREVRGLIAVLYVANRALFNAMAALTVLAVACYYGPSFFANRIFAVLEDEALADAPHARLARALPWVLALFATVIVSSTIQGQLWSILEAHLTVRITTQLSTMLYNKTLVRRNASRDDGGPSSSSQVLTLHLVDLKRVAAMLFDLTMLINIPFELAFGGYFAYRVLGVSALVGLASTLVLVPLITLVSRRFARTNERLMAARDQRMGLLNECFLGIRMIKSQAWERRFGAHILAKRRDELRSQRRTFLLEALLSTLLELNPLLVTVVAFAHYTLVMHASLTPKTAFTSLAVFTELRWTLTMLPESLTDLMQGLVSLRRIGVFLVSDQVPPAPPAAAAAAAPGVALHDATVAWPSEAGAPPPFALRGVSLAFAPGARHLICGRTGAGKSLLLHALLHEADVRAGRVECPRSPCDAVPYDEATRRAAADALGTPAWVRAELVAYAPQAPYLMNATLRDNVLFGLPLGDGARYHAVLDACALRGDLAQLEHGDLTPVGEDGTELSGGQKARVALARAVYSRAGVLLLDDVLSAVDAHTAKHLAEHLLGSALLDERTVLLVSHNVPLVAPYVRHVVLLDDGAVAFQGTSDAFLASPLYTGLRDAPPPRAAPPPATAPPAAPARAHGPRAPERRARGHIAWRVWRAYIQASSGWPLCAVTLALFAASNLWELVTNAWLREWSATLGHSVHPSAWWLVRYVALVLAGMLFGVLRWVGLYAMSLCASNRLFDRMLWRTLRAPLRFHDLATRGGLLNRFGQDLEVLDSKFARAIADVTIKATQLLATCLALYIVSGWQFVAALLALTPLYSTLAQHYIATARDLQRLTSTSRSRVVSAFGNAVHGVVTLRAYGAQQRFTHEMHTVLDNHNRFVWWAAQGGRWISQMFNLVSAFLVLGACVSILLQRSLDASLADFSITFLIELNFILLILMRMYTVFQTSGVAVERVFEYADTIEQEAPETTAVRPPPHWPADGHVVVRDLCVRYAPDAPDVLHNVSFAIAPGAKLAVVGPTGSGKSTLASALLRFVEPHAGSVQIDGVDLAQLGLTDLRARLQIVPQDPVILSGTLRSALDVFGEFDDPQLLEALRRVALVTSDNSTFADLDFRIAEGGSNLSQGQRQLLCLARATLRRSHVVVFDEASSSIDYDTDVRITQVIQDTFRFSTVLTIAHRLRSVIAYDQLLFLDHGHVAEMGEPHALLQNPASRFYRLCQSAGAAEFAHLADAARRAHEQRTT
ncbi:hypothetical protein MBRA1_001381 [Malassezia brasiliensis]|uniref:Uncharacterized protein n=1 Tax=Malassezia brasiliensis TaxID=1821822 RepID=A0AAF0DSQ0_9BASI|nr:hypothetical protein MBRA1_001381 [Malassezia brasiliensis]